MKQNQNQPSNAAERRRRAEARLSAREQTPQPAIRNPQSEQRLIHELEVHQIELEMQNEELERGRARTDSLLAQYTDLYDFAPTGYFNLAADGTILAVNLTGARFLGSERAQLLHRHFGLLVSEADRPVFKAFLDKTFAGKERKCCEVALLRAETAPLIVRIEAVVSEGGGECRAAVLDITERHQAEAERERLIQELQTALARVKQLSGLLPICANCKRIRNDEGYWSQVESYVSSHSEATFSHGICPECLHTLYPDQEKQVNEGMERKKRQNVE
jgi:PAS domain S-box-containing protein